MFTGGGKPGSCGAKQIGPRCSQAFARLTDVRQAGLVSGGYPDSYLLDLGLLRCWSCEVVRSKGVRKIESWLLMHGGAQTQAIHYQKKEEKENSSERFGVHLHIKKHS